MLLTIAIISTLFYGQVPQQFIPMMHIAAVATPTLLLITYVLTINSKPKGNNSAPEVATEKLNKEDSAAAVELSQEASNEAAVVQFLARLQEKGRLLDFLMDDIAAYDNESVGAAARIVHQGCCEVLNESFTIETVHPGAEMEEITLADNYDSTAYRLSGQVPESGPFAGSVMHRGWKTTRVNLPQLVATVENINSSRSIIAPAEVEIS